MPAPLDFCQRCGRATIDGMRYCYRCSSNGDSKLGYYLLAAIVIALIVLAVWLGKG
jgi:hypothetical protein